MCASTYLNAPIYSTCASSFSKQRSLSSSVIFIELSFFHLWLIVFLLPFNLSFLSFVLSLAWLLLQAPPPPICATHLCRLQLLNRRSWLLPTPTHTNAQNMSVCLALALPGQSFNIWIHSLLTTFPWGTFWCTVWCCLLCLNESCRSVTIPGGWIAPWT